jgi:hypothetical protein
MAMTSRAANDDRRARHTLTVEPHSASSMRKNLTGARDGSRRNAATVSTKRIAVNLA